jgi:hypothetical protein
MLEEDAMRFDAFLKENDEKVQEAIKHADTEAKAKQDKVGSCGSLWVSPACCLTATAGPQGRGNPRKHALGLGTAVPAATTLAL